MRTKFGFVGFGFEATTRACCAAVTASRREVEEDDDISLLMGGVVKQFVEGPDSELIGDIARTLLSMLNTLRCDHKRNGGRHHRV